MGIEKEPDEPIVSPKEETGVGSKDNPVKIAERAVSSLNDISHKLAAAIKALSIEAWKRHPNILPVQERFGEIRSSIEIFDIGQIKTALLCGAKEASEVSQNLTANALQMLNELFSVEKHMFLLQRVENPDCAEMVKEAGLVLGLALNKITPAIQDIMKEPSFLNILRAKLKQYDAYRAENFVNAVSFFLDDKASSNAYTVINETGLFNNRGKVLRSEKGMTRLMAKLGDETQQRMLEELYYEALLEKTPLASSGEWPREEREMLPTWFEKGGNISMTQPIVERAFARAKKTFEDKYGFALRDITKKQRVEVHQWPFVIGGVAELENKRKGAAKALSDRYGIHMFYRYPATLLLQQLDEEQKQKPYGVFIGAYDDHNLAFSKNKDRLAHIGETLAQGGMGIKILEAGSGTDVMRQLIRLHKQYGNSHKIEFMVVAAHGQPTSFLLSEHTDSAYGHVTSEILEGKGVLRLKEFFVDQPEIVLMSCSTGAEGGIGEKFSEKFKAHVIAPREPTSTESIRVSLDENRKPHFLVEFAGGDSVTRRFGPK